MSQPAPIGTLGLRLVGSWRRFDPHDPEQVRRAAMSFATSVTHKRDDAPLERARIVGQTVELMQRARSAHAQAVFVCEEIEPGVSFPAMVTVMRLEPLGEHDRPWPVGSGNSAFAVLKAMLASRPEYADAEFDGASVAGSVGVRVSCTRLTSVSASDVGAEGEDAEVRVLVIDYWSLVEGRAEAWCVACVTPLVDAPLLVTSLFDAMVADARLSIDT